MAEMSFNLWTRKWHRWGAIWFSLPMLFVIVTGILLQVKKQVAWIQPPTQQGSVPNQDPGQQWSDILQISREVPEAKVTGWDDIKRLYVEPGKGIIKVLCRNRWEIQIDMQTGEVLSSTLRRSDWVESLHDGSFFSPYVKWGVFLPSGIVLFILWLSGLWLWYLPHRNRKRKKG